MPDFEIRRKFWLHTALAVLALAVAAAFGWQSAISSSLFGYAMAALFAVLFVVHVTAARDARTPLLVADEQGVRLRIGRDWFGLLWADIGDIRIEPRHGLWDDAFIKVVSVDGLRIYTTPVGAATNVSVKRARVELSARRRAPAY